jgi:transaldolase
MEIFLDSADLDEIREAARWGILGGVTTNPTLLARAGRRDVEAALREICSLCSGPVSVEAVSVDAAGMLEEARRFASWAPQIVVKLPLTPEGLAATSACREEGIPTNVTLCFSVAQGLLAAAAGATIVSPFAGRLDDIASDGLGVVRDLAAIFRLHGIATKVLAASLRHPMHVVEAARVGAHIATVPFAVLRQMVSHPLTETGLERFLADWRALQAIAPPVGVAG